MSKKNSFDETAKDQINQNNLSYKESEKIFQLIDKTIYTLFNEPSLGLYYTQKHIEGSFPVLINNMDKLNENKKVLSNTTKDINITNREITELTQLNNDFSFKMLAMISSINFELSKKK